MLGWEQSCLLRLLKQFPAAFGKRARRGVAADVSQGVAPGGQGSEACLECLRFLGGQKAQQLDQWALARHTDDALVFFTARKHGLAVLTRNVRDFDLHRIDLARNVERPVTRGGTEARSHGLAEFVAQEEMGRSVRRSPTTRWNIAFISDGSPGST